MEVGDAAPRCLTPKPAEPEPTRLPGLQAPDPELQAKQFLEPEVFAILHKISRRRD
jgi:hypothetical protein